MLLSTLFLAACNPSPDLDAAPRWALVWAEVTPSNEGFQEREDGAYTNFVVWEFYADGWEKKHDPEYYKCKVVHDVVATPWDCPLSAPGCVSAYTLDATLNEESTDCEASIQADPSYAGPARIAIGDLPEDIAGSAPYNEWTLGWYLAFDTAEVSAHGYAYDKVLEADGRPAGQGWVPGSTYVLWPAYVWEL